MSVLSRKEVTLEPEPDIGGTEALRRHLNRFTTGVSGVSFGKVAGDLNHEMNQAAARSAAREMAKRMSSPEANDDEVRRLANSLLNTLGNTTDSVHVTERQLEDFVAGADLDSVAVKQALAGYLNNGFATWDPELDKLRLIDPPVPPIKGGRVPPAFIHPDPLVAQANAARNAALAKTYAPLPPRSVPLTPGAQVPVSLKRPGFAD